MIRSVAVILLLLGASSSAIGSDLDERERAALGITDAPVASQAGAWNWTHGPYQYDGSGNIAAIGTQAFLYDTRGRLVSATVQRPDQPGSLTQTYEYDVYGNMTRRTLEGTTTVMATDAATNHLTAFGTVYDDAGNVTQWQTPTTSRTYAATYDALGMIQELRVTNVAGAGNDRFLYTADDERIATLSRTGDTSHWTLRGVDGKVLREFTVNGSVWSLSRDYVYRDGMLMAAVTPTRTLYFSLDHLGTPRVITDDAGVRVGFHHYLPFGEEWTDNTGAQEGERMKFTGHERDRDLVGSMDGLDYMHARFYSAGMGRFLSVDPTWDSADLGAPQTSNRYAYARNNPLRYTDPDGRVAIADDILIGAFVGTMLLATYATAPSAVPGKSNGQVMMETAGSGLRSVGRWLLNGNSGGGGDQMAAETSVQNWAKSEQVKQDSAQNTNGTLPKPPRGTGSVPPEDRDPKRKFSPQEREAKRDAQGGQCANGCGNTIDQSNSNGHHVVRHSDGGKTNDKNHAEVCIDCHKKLHSPPL